MGAGLIGTEAASTASATGTQVTLVGPTLPRKSSGNHHFNLAT
ncbi:hypothetical protein [Dermatophilus congolensis]